MNILFIFSSDSYMAYGLALASHLSRANNCISVALINGMDTKNNTAKVYNFKNIQLINLTSEELNTVDWKNYDACILGIPPSILRTYLNYFENLKEINGYRPKIVTYLPGILQEKKIEGLYKRSNVDVLLLDSKRNLSLYLKVGKSLNFNTNNVHTIGMLSIDNYKIDGPFCSLNVNPKQHILFVEQKVVPYKLSERILLMEKLVKLADKTKYKVLIKPRSRRCVDETISGVKDHIEDIYDAFNSIGLIPKNLHIDHSDVFKLLKTSKYCMSISSSVIISAMLTGIPAILITDFGIKDQFGNEFYLDSGCFKGFSEINENDLPLVNLNWFHFNKECRLKKAEDVTLMIEKSKFRNLIKKTTTPYKRVMKYQYIYLKFLINMKAVFRTVTNYINSCINK